MRRRSAKQRPHEPVDEWLETLNLFRKQVPKDGSSLFRAAAEQLCFTQSYHKKVRHLILDYMLIHQEYFQTYLSQPVEKYVRKMRNPMELGGTLEIIALGLLFKVDCLVFSEINSPPTNVTEFGFESQLMMYLRVNHFDIVYRKKYTAIAGFCQAMVYEMLYSKVFGLKKVMSVVDQMLRDSSLFLRKDSFNSEGQELDILRIVEQAEAVNPPEAVLDSSFECSSHEKGLIPPFPYRVAKALDPHVYRNSDHDIWIAQKREARYGPYDHKGLQIGVKVVIKLHLAGIKEKLTNSETSANSGGDDSLWHLGQSIADVPIKLFHGHIQDMSENQGPAEVFVEELGKRVTVPYMCLERIPQTPARASVEEPRFPSSSPSSYRSLSPLTRRLPPLPLPSARSVSNPRKSALHSLPISIQSKKSKGPHELHEVEMDNSRAISSPTSQSSSPPVLPMSISTPQKSSNNLKSFETDANWNPNEGSPVFVAGDVSLPPTELDAVPCFGPANPNEGSPVFVARDVSLPPTELDAVPCFGSARGINTVFANIFTYPVDTIYPYTSYVAPYLPQCYYLAGSEQGTEYLPVATSLTCPPAEQINPEVVPSFQGPLFYPASDSLLYYPPPPFYDPSTVTPVLYPSNAEESVWDT